MTDDAPRVPHRAVAGRTFGIEEEFLLTDGATGQAAPRASRVLAAARRNVPSAPDASLQAELSGAQVEAATGCCTELSVLAGQLRHAREQLAIAAHGENARLMAAGTPVLAGPDPPIAGGERYARIADSYAGMIRGYQACGCHVHVGVADRDTALAVLNHLRPWLAVLLALSTNSPYHFGADTGYASWRIVRQTSFPSAGVPQRFTSTAAYDAEISRLVESGVLADDHMSFWLARLSPHLPTVELRVADAATTVSEAVLQATLARALVRASLRELDAGREAPSVENGVAAAAVWNAARYGLRGPGVHPFWERRIPAVELVGQLLDRVAPDLETTGDLATVRDGVEALLTRGTGAERQRAIARRRGLRAVVDTLVGQTISGNDEPPPLAEAGASSVVPEQRD